MAQAFHIRLRKKMSQLTHKLLYKIFPLNANLSPIDKGKIEKILVVRINYRIGNIIFTTPLLNALAKEFPHAQIDMMIGAPFISPLIEKMPQITKVYTFPRVLLKQPLKLLKLKKELKENKYDLLIAPSLFSSSDTLFTLLVNAEYKVGFYSENVFAPLTHGVAFPTDIEHEALKPLALMSAFGKNDINYFDNFLDIRVSSEEKSEVRGEIKSHTIGIFRDARGEKKLDEEWWRELLGALQRRDSSLHFIDILDPNNTTPLTQNIETLSEKNLRVLASKIANLNAFICADTGPMHLSSASQTPTIALFKATSPTLYGTLGSRDLSLEMGEKSIEEISLEIVTHLESVNASSII